MTTKSQSAELAVLLVKHIPGTEALAPKVARSLVRHAKALHRLYEHECNRELRPSEREAMTRHEGAVERLCDTIGIRRVDFNGDPRGFPVKLHLGNKPFDLESPEQPYNTWGGAQDGWGIG